MDGPPGEGLVTPAVLTEFVLTRRRGTVKRAKRAQFYRRQNEYGNRGLKASDASDRFDRPFTR